jgi:transcriptional regulator with PAS, ATPase and Fis domain
LATAAARTTMPVLLLGESGTGKEVFAQAIHEASDRRGRPFVAVNCAALPRELIESELFGYVNGAFTGARREGSVGKFRSAEGGTIFLDEISEMPLSAQATLLRVLQEQEVSAIGSNDVHALNVRVLAATNRDAVDAVRAGQLRADLYYRLNVLTIELPALRDRRADVPMLVEHLLSLAASELQRPGLHFAPDVLALLAQRDWPGNVRELKNLVCRAAALSTSDLLTIEHVQHHLPAPLHGMQQQLLRGAGRAVTGSGTDASDAYGSGADGSSRDAIERARTVEAMQGSRTMHDAARRLGINRSTLYRRLERFGLTSTRLLQAQ